MGGGWRRGLIRLAVGAVFLACVLWFAPGDALALVARPAVWLWVAVGGLVHLIQRAARIAKWRAMLSTGSLKQLGFLPLIKLQFIGMLANLLLPISEALKVWAVSKGRQQAKFATLSIVLDTAMHAFLVGALGTVGCIVTATSDVWLWSAALSTLIVAAVMVAGLHRWPTAASSYYQLSPRAWGWCAVETTAQLALYVFALSAVGAEMSIKSTLAAAPMLFVADLVMLTPSGVGARETLFAIVLQLESGPAAAQVGVASGLVLSAMLLAATIVGGGLALAAPQKPTSQNPVE